MAEKSIIKFPQHLAAKNLKDVYFQEVFDFLTSFEEKKYLSRLEDTLGKEKKTNWKTTLRNRRNGFIKNKEWKFQKI